MMPEIVEATVQLADALAAENAALAALDLVAAVRLLPQKEAATTAFAAAQRRARGTRDTLDIKALRVAATRLQTLTEENRRLLERAIHVQNRVMGILAQAARASNPTPRYARSGVYAKRPTASWALSASV